MSRLATFHTDTVMITEDCCNCGMLFALPKAWQDRRRDDGATFYCPAGHPQSYTKSRVSILQGQLEEAERKACAAKCEALNAQAQVVSAHAKVAEMEKASARQRKRIHACVCPCCNRTFSNVARHMKTKHPEAPLAKARLP